MEIESGNTFQIKIKWGRKKMELEVDSTDDLESFKAKVYSLTSVLPDKQKVLYKGKVIKTEDQFKGIDFSKKNCLVGIIGKAEGTGQNLDKIEQKKFFEDMNEEERAKLFKGRYNEVLPFGLVNLGNTCYINSTIQVMRRIPELSKAIKEAKEGPLTMGMKNIFNELDTLGDSVEPRMFISIFMSVFPEFSQQTQNGAFQQQDADECFQKMLNSVDPYLKSSSGSLVDDLFKFEVKFNLKNTENEQEPEVSSIETMRKLLCIIDNQANPVNTIREGITAGLLEEIEKYSESENKNCMYEKVGKIINLPKYLIVQKIRFIWKEKDLGTVTDARKAKILRKVAFPMILDLNPFCSEDLVEKFKPNLELQKKRADAVKDDKKEFEEFSKQFNGDKKMDTLKISKLWKKEKKFKAIELKDRELWREHGTGLETGEYGLMGVITHKGRSADSGHYVGWTQYRGDDWHRYDDDIVTKVNTEEILKLSGHGGGDWHIAYYLVYRKMEIDK